MICALSTFPFGWTSHRIERALRHRLKLASQPQKPIAMPDKYIKIARPAAF